MSKEQIQNALSRNQTPDIDVWNVDNAIEAPATQTAEERRRAEQDWNDYLKSRDYADQNMNIHDAATGRFKSVDMEPRNSQAYYDAKINELSTEETVDDIKLTDLIESAKEARATGEEAKLNSLWHEIDFKLEEMIEKHDWDRETTRRHYDNITEMIEGGNSPAEVTAEKSEEIEPASENTAETPDDVQDESEQPNREADKADQTNENQENSDQKLLEIDFSENETENKTAEPETEADQPLIIEPIPLEPDNLADDSLESSFEEDNDNDGETLLIEPIPLDDEPEDSDHEKVDELLERADKAANDYARLNARGRVKRGILNRKKFNQEIEQARNQWQEHTKNLIEDELEGVDLTDVAEENRQAHLQNLGNKHSRAHANRLLEMTEYYERAIAPKEGGRKKKKALAAVAFAVGFVTKIVTKFTIMRQGVDMQTADLVGNVAATGAGAATGVMFDHNNIKYRRISEVDQGDNGVITAAERDRKDDQNSIEENDGSLEKSAEVIEQRTEKVRKDNRNRALGNIGLGGLFGLFGGLSSELIRGEQGEQGEKGDQGIEGPQGPQPVVEPPEDSPKNGLPSTGV